MPRPRQRARTSICKTCGPSCLLGLSPGHPLCARSKETREQAERSPNLLGRLTNKLRATLGDGRYWVLCQQVTGLPQSSQG